MRISHTLALVCLLLSMLTATTSHAKVYRCKDAAGSTVFSGTPCGGDAQELNIAMIGTDREVRQPEPSQRSTAGAATQAAKPTTAAQATNSHPQSALQPLKRRT